MKTLGVLRHAKSDWDDVSLRDFDRGLNRRGRRGAALMGRHIREHGIAWDMILASPAERVRLTLEASGLEQPVTWDQRAYLADSAMLLSLLAQHGGDAGAVLIAGHNPGLQELIFALVGPESENANENALFAQVAEKYPTAAFAVLELDVERWEDCTPGCGRLVHLARPRDLDPELGPKRLR